jgi:hypothetical protein
LQKYRFNSDVTNNRFVFPLITPQKSLQRTNSTVSSFQNSANVAERRSTTKIITSPTKKTLFVLHTPFVAAHEEHKMGDV